MNTDNSQSVSAADSSTPSTNVQAVAADAIVPPTTISNAQSAVPEPVLTWMQQTIQSMAKPVAPSSPATNVQTVSPVLSLTPPTQVDNSTTPAQPLHSQPPALSSSATNTPTVSSVLPPTPPTEADNPTPPPQPLRSEPPAPPPSQPVVQPSSAAMPPQIVYSAVADTSTVLPTRTEPQVPASQQPTPPIAAKADALNTVAPKDDTPVGATVTQTSPPVSSTRGADPVPPTAKPASRATVQLNDTKISTPPSVHDEPSVPQTASFVEPATTSTSASPASGENVPQLVVTPPESGSTISQAQSGSAGMVAPPAPVQEPAFSFLRQIFERPMPGAPRCPEPVATDNVHPILRPIPKHALRIIESFRTTHLSTNATAGISATMPDFSGLVPKDTRLKTAFDAYLQNKVFDKSHRYADTLPMFDEDGMHEFVRTFTPKPVFVDHKVHEPPIGTLTRAWVEKRPKDTYLRGHIKFDVSTERGRRVVETIHAIGGTDLSLGAVHEFRNGRRVNTHIHEISVVGTGKYGGSFLQTAASAGGGGTPASGILVQLCSIDIPATNPAKRARIN